MGQHGAPLVHLELTLANFGLTADNFVLIWVDKGLNPVNSYTYTHTQANLKLIWAHLGLILVNLGPT